MWGWVRKWTSRKAGAQHNVERLLLHFFLSLTKFRMSQHVEIVPLCEVILAGVTLSTVLHNRCVYTLRTNERREYFSLKAIIIRTFVNRHLVQTIKATKHSISQLLQYVSRLLLNNKTSTYRQQTHRWFEQFGDCIE